MCDGSLIMILKSSTEFLAANVRKREDWLTGWVALLRYQRVYKRPQRLTNANS